VLNRKQRAHRSQTTGLGRIGRVLLSVALGTSTLVGASILQIPAAHATSAGDGLDVYWRNDTLGVNADNTYQSNSPPSAFTSGTCLTGTGFLVNIVWNADTSPGGSCNADNWDTYATGYIRALTSAAQTMYFCDLSDDGFYLKINNTVVINNWVNQGGKSDGTCNGRGSFSFAANTAYTIEAFHHETGGGAEMILKWGTTNSTSASDYQTLTTTNLANHTNGNSLLIPTNSMPSSLPTLSYGQTSYDYGGYVTGGNSGYTFSITSGSLPSILSMNSGTGRLLYNSSGTFSAATYNFTIHAVDANGFYVDVSSSIQVLKRNISVTALAVSSTFGDNFSLSSFSYSGSLMGSDSFTVSETSTATTGSNVGTYTIYPTVNNSWSSLGSECASNALNCYSISYNTGTLTINQRPITVKANPVSRTYGTSNPTLSGYTITSGTMYSTDTFTASETTTASIGSSVGTYPITQGTYAFSAGSQSNYAITFVNDTLTVIARPLTVKANSLTKNYGDANPSLTGYSITSGSTYSTDTFTVTGSTTAAQGSSVGSYPVTQTLNSFTSGTASNYSLTFVADTLTVGVRVLTIKANSITRNYGVANPSLNGFSIVSGSLYNTDSFTVIGSTSATQSSDVGAYSITQSLNSFSPGSSSNYSIVYTPDTLTITAAPITVKANSLSRKYGVANPNLNGFTITSGSTYSTDTFTVTGSTAATINSNIGTYPVTQVLNAFTTGKSTNYNLNFQSDSLTVTKADTLTITANTLSDVTYKYSGATITPGFSTSGLAGTDVITIPSSNGYLYNSYTSQTCAQGGFCKVGDTGPGGGIVIYVDYTQNLDSSSFSSGGHYLEAAPAAVASPSTSAFCNIYNLSTSSVPSYPDGLGIGYGAANTAGMLSYCSSGAAYTARSYVGQNSKTDWFLPSSEELKLIDTVTVRSLLNMPAGSYWSSTVSPIQNSQSYAYIQSTHSIATNMGQPSALYVWPIRAFSNTFGSASFYGPSSTKPSSVGSYTITIDSTTANFTSGSANNYTAISYMTGTVNITKAIYQYLKANANVSVLTYPYGQSLQLFAVSDSGDTTTATFNVTNGTNSSCTLSNITTTTASLSATSTGGGYASCLITLSRAASANFNAIVGDTTTVNFVIFAPVAAAPVVAGGGNMAIGIGDPISIAPPVTGDTTTVTAATITSVYDNTTSSASVFHAGDNLTLTGTNLNGVTQIKFLAGGTTQTFAANLSQTSLTFTLPGDVLTGPVLVQKPSPDGIGFKTGRFNITIS
jgi:MBG domain (YGX type)/PA14 domain